MVRCLRQGIIITARCGTATRGLSGLVCLLVVAGLLASGSGSAAATSPPLPQYGGEVLIGDDQEPPTLNPFMPGGDNAIVARIGQAHLTGVQNIDPETLEFIPEVVTELPSVANGGLTVNPDGTETVRYHIRPEAVWADGVPISGDDFRFTYDTIMDPALPIDRTTYEDILPGSVVAGPKTFEYTLAEPTAAVETLFGTIIPKHDVEGSDFAADWNDRAWVAGGPFEFETWVAGEYLRLVRNDHYWRTDPSTGQPLPYLDAVEFRFAGPTGGPDFLIDGFVARELDVIPLFPDLDDYAKAEAAGDGAQVQVVASPIWEQVNFQYGENRLGRNPASQNEHLRFRQAVAHAIDKDRIVQELLGGLLPPLDSYLEVYRPSLSQGAWAQYDYDPAAAQALVNAHCAEVVPCGPNGQPSAVFSTSSNNDARVALSLLLADMFADAGIAYEAQLEDSSIFFGETLDFGRWDVGEWAWAASPGYAGLRFIHGTLDPDAAPPEGMNFYRWGTPAVSGVDPDGFNQGPSSVIDAATARYAEIVDEMEATVDARDLDALIVEAESLLADNAVIIPLYARPDGAAVWADEIGGYVYTSSPATDTWNVEQWHRVDGVGQILGLVDPATGQWHLLDAAQGLRSFAYGDPGDLPFMGDWDCDGVATPGLYRQSDGFVYLRNRNTQGNADIRFFFGDPGDVPLAGDFDDDGCDTVSIYRPSEQRFYIIDELGENDGGLGAADYSFVFGDPGDQPVVGDWDGDGIDEIGLHRATTGLFYWRNRLSTGNADAQIFFGDPGDRFVAGDWGVVDGRDTPGVFRPSDAMFYLRYTLTQGNADSAFGFGESTWLPVAGSDRLD